MALTPVLFTGQLYVGGIYYSHGLNFELGPRAESQKKTHTFKGQVRQKELTRKPEEGTVRDTVQEKRGVTEAKAATFKEAGYQRKDWMN